MPTITSAGIGSGLDVNGLVAQLVAAEGAPIANRLARQESGIRLELSAFGQFRGALSSVDSALAALVSADDLDARQASVEDEDVFTATAAAGAAVGSFSVEVQQLAESHRLASTTPISPAGSNVGYGQLDLTLGGEAFSVTISDTAQTLDDVKNAINNATDNPGIQATVLTTDAGEVLQLSSSVVGSASEITIAASGGDGGLDTLVADLGQTESFQGSVIFVDGYQVSSDSNTVTGVIEGVTINLAEARPGEQFDLNINRDQSAAIDAMSAFVKAYNSYVDQADIMGSYDSETGSAGTLNGDSILRSANNQLRQSLTANYGPDAMSLSQFGIELDVEGRLVLDEAALGEAVGADFQAFRNFLEGEDGFSASVQSITTRYIEDDGVIDGRVDSLNGRLERIEDQGDALNDRIDRLEARYLKQFAALDAMLAQLQQTSSYLGQQLANLPGVANNNSNS